VLYGEKGLWKYKRQVCTLWNECLWESLGRSLVLWVNLTNLAIKKTLNSKFHLCLFLFKRAYIFAEVLASTHFKQSIELFPFPRNFWEFHPNNFCTSVLPTLDCQVGIWNEATLPSGGTGKCYRLSERHWKKHIMPNFFVCPIRHDQSIGFPYVQIYWWKCVLHGIQAGVKATESHDKCGHNWIRWNSKSSQNSGTKRSVYKDAMNLLWELFAKQLAT
jgi:hypothetical protein